MQGPKSAESRDGRAEMLADAHRQAALDIEQSIADMGDPAAKPYLSRSAIELYWAAAFH